MNADADVFLQDVTGEWNVIIADFPDPSTPDLAKLYSAEFYGLIKRHLANNGIFVAQASSPYANRSAFWSIRDTIEAAGFQVKSLHAYVPTFGEWGWHVAKLAEPPSLDGFSVVNLRHLDAPTLAASLFFPSHISRPVGHSQGVDPDRSMGYATLSTWRATHRPCVLPRAGSALGYRFVRLRPPVKA